MPLSIRSLTSTSRRTRRTQDQRARRAAATAILRAPTVYAVAPRTELKFTRSNLLTDHSSISSAWSEHGYTGIAQGVDTQQRIGNRIALHSFTLHGVLAAGANGTATDDQYNVVRLIVALWKQSESNTPMANYYAYDTSSINAPINKRTNFIGSKLIKKLYDQYIPLQVASTERAQGDGYAPGLAKVDLYYKFKKPIIIEYATAASTTSASYGADKNLVLSCISDSTAIVNPGFVAGYGELAYYDV